ncbi:hypothetical protein L0222_29635, partial [bacterium]|nr:hypothetical protein [bacterium]
AALKQNNENFDAMLNLGYAYLEVQDKSNALLFLRDFEKNAPPTRYRKDLAEVRSLINKLQ